MTESITQKGRAIAQSKLIKAFEGWNKDLLPYSAPPEGMFHRRAIVKTWKTCFDSDNIDIEFTVPFDDDIEANEAEIIIYNLSEKTIAKLNWNDNIQIFAGYQNDTGLIFNGYITSVKSFWRNNDFVTSVKAIDNAALSEFDIVEKTYARYTKASRILKELINELHIPNPVFNIKRDHVFQRRVKVSGSIMKNIKKYAEICGISVYINRGNIYARHISEGDNIRFAVTADTGLIGSPEAFTKEKSVAEYKDVVNGYKLKMLLQHRLTTAAIVDISSRNVNGAFRIRQGRHIFNEKEAVTEIEVI